MGGQVISNAGPDLGKIYKTVPLSPENNWWGCLSSFSVAKNKALEQEFGICISVVVLSWKLMGN